MRAIILAAGRGSRMGPMSRRQPKCLIKIHGKTLLDRQIAAIRAAGIKEISIVTGYCRAKLQHRGLREFHNSRWATTNMVSSLACANAWLKIGSCIVSYGDIIYEAKAVRLLKNQRSGFVISYDANWERLWSKRFRNPLEDAETFRITKKGRVLEIGGRAKSKKEIKGQYMGLFKINQKAWQKMQIFLSHLKEKTKENLQMTHLLNLMIEKKRISVKAVPYNGTWFEFDKETDIKLAKKIIKN